MGTRLGQLVRDARHRAGRTLEDVAEQVGVTEGALSHIESGRRLPSPSNAVAIAEALDLPPEDILLALDDEHASRRRSSVTASRAGSSSPSPASAPSRVYQALPIEELFGAAPERYSDFDSPVGRIPPLADAPPLSMRHTARWSDDTAERIEALEELSGTAASAIRTLRGLLDDEDPAIAREARRLLRELDVRLPEE